MRSRLAVELTDEQIWVRLKTLCDSCSGFVIFQKSITDGPTDRRMDTASYIDARMHLKIKVFWRNKNDKNDYKKVFRLET